MDYFLLSSKLIDSATDYWYMWLILAALTVFLVWSAKKAAAAVRRRRSRLDNESKELERYKYLLNKYSDYPADTVKNADPKELCEGVTACVQRKIEKAVHMNDEFNLCPQWQKCVYSLWYFGEDSKKNLSFFFKNNGEPVVSLASEWFKSHMAKSLSSLVSEMFSMYDEKNEKVSLIPSERDRIDEKFKEKFSEDDFFAEIKKYILENLGV